MPYIPNVVVVGSINVDLVVTVDKFPVPGETLIGVSFRQVGGGKGANQAVAAARLGAPVSLVARVGDDAFGKKAITALEAEGIDCRYVLTTPDTPTGIAAITVQESTGENNIVVVPGANGLLAVADIEGARDVIATASVLVLSLEVPIDVIEAAAQIACEHGVPVVLNPAPARLLSTQLLEKVTVLIPNETEAMFLAGTSDIPAAAGFLSKQLASDGLAVVTQGGLGILAAPRDRGQFYMPAIRVVDVVDTVGAGDCFTGALSVGLAEKREEKEALHLALAAAALAVTRSGAQDAMPRRSEVDALLKSTGA